MTSNNSLTIRVPVGTKKGAVVGINGIPYVLCQGDKDLCYDQQFRPRSYVDASGDPTTDKCDAVAVDLNAATQCCSGVHAVWLPNAIAGSAHGTALYVNEYANDGTAIPDLATSGPIYAGYIARSFDCNSPSPWDNLTPEAPTGYTRGYMHVASPHDAIVLAEVTP